MPAVRRVCTPARDLPRHSAIRMMVQIAQPRRHGGREWYFIRV
jgi:hypothetical protein